MTVISWNILLINMSFYWKIIYLFKSFLTFDYTLKYAVRELKLGHSQEAFSIFSVKFVIARGTHIHIINVAHWLIKRTCKLYMLWTRKNRRFHWWFNFVNIWFGLLDGYGCKWGIFEAHYRAYWWLVEYSKGSDYRAVQHLSINTQDPLTFSANRFLGQPFGTRKV